MAEASWSIDRYVADLPDQRLQLVCNRRSSLNAWNWHVYRESAFGSGTVPGWETLRSGVERSLEKAQRAAECAAREVR